MKIVPKIISKEQQILAEAKVQYVTRKTALALAFVSVFFFFLKLLFL